MAKCALGTHACDGHMKIECSCGSLIHDGGDDLPHKAHIVPDKLWNKTFEAIDKIVENAATKAQRDAACTRIRALVSEAARMAWQCRDCGRIYIDDVENKLQAYAPEEGAARELFRR